MNDHYTFEAMAAYTASEVESFVSDVERASNSASSSSSSRRKYNFGLKHAAAGVIGGAALAACGATVHSMTQTKSDMVTARMLFESPDVHNVVAHNVVNIASSMPKFDHSKEEVHKMVKSTFNQLSGLLAQHDPETLRALESTQVSKEQRNAIVRMLGYLSDPRVMDVGLAAAKALREAKTDDPEALKKVVTQKLQSKAREIANLHAEAVDKSLFSVADKQGEGFKSLLLSEHGPKKVAVLASIGDDWYKKLGLDNKKLEHEDTSMQQPVITGRRLQYNPQAAGYAGAQQPAAAPHYPGGQPPVSPGYKKAEEAIGIISTALAEADALIRIINPLCKILPHGHDLHIPPMVTSVLGATDFAGQIASCELDGAADGNPEEMMGCPAMSASAGFDMLREPCTLVGICGDNNDKNGHQGNHAGHGGVHAGILDDGARGKDFKKEEYKYPMCMLFGTCDKKPPKKRISSTTTEELSTTKTTTESTTKETTTTEATTTASTTTEKVTTASTISDLETTAAATTEEASTPSTTFEWSTAATTEEPTTPSTTFEWSTSAFAATEIATSTAATMETIAPGTTASADTTTIV